ncbi:MAG: hypothetical protein KQI35_06695 [Bacteroidetes bacterium]|nr:hypothetical protein [Bacteroidota bacterium]
MNSVIGIYHTHEEAINAVRLLKGDDIPDESLSLMGKTSIHPTKEGLTEHANLKEAPVAIGAIAGPVLGVLTGVGIFAIPGLGFLYGAGALVGALAGLDFGLVGGGIISLLATLGIRENYQIKLKEHLDEGKVILIVKGNKEIIDKAHKILQDYNKHHELMHA